MAVTMNLAQKFSGKVDEKFALSSVTENIGLNKDYDFAGVNAINAYTLATASLADYDRDTGFGTSVRTDAKATTYTLSQDKGFKYHIDLGDAQETMGALVAGKQLAREIKYEIVPALDKYRLGVWGGSTIAKVDSTAVAITSSNAYSQFLKAQKILNNKFVPVEGRVCFCNQDFKIAIKTDDNFVKASDIAEKMLINGQFGEIDGVKLISVPDSYMPANTAFILMHPSVTMCPKKLTDYRTITNSEQYSGTVTVGRIIHDCFILNSKKDGIVKCMLPTA